MNILIYGFRPWGKSKENITEKILAEVKNEKDMKKIVFEVKFDRKQFIKEIMKINPKIIIGLGQCSAGNRLRVERRSVNLKKDGLSKNPSLISRNGSQFLFSSLRINKNEHLGISYDAGKYVCNYSMYVISDFIKNRNIKFGFIHIPREYSVSKAARQVEDIIKIAGIQGKLYGKYIKTSDISSSFKAVKN